MIASEFSGLDMAAIGKSGASSDFCTLTAKEKRKNLNSLIVSYLEGSTIGPGAHQIQNISKREACRVQRALKGLDLPYNAFVFATGSSGNLENVNSHASPMPIVILFDTAHIISIEEKRLFKASQEAIQTKIDALISTDCLRGVDPRIEWKDPKSERLITCNITSTVIPSRFLHHFPLIGSASKRNKLMYQFVSEVQKMTGKERQKFRRDFVMNHRRQLNGAIEGTNTKGIDLENGVISYGSKGNQATKYSLLDTIKYTLDLCIIDAIRDQRHWPKEYVWFLEHMPRTIPEQIDFMARERLLPHLNKQDIADLKSAYTLGLFYLHTAQDLYTHQGAPVQFGVTDKNELQKAYTDTKRILAKI